MAFGAETEQAMTFAEKPDNGVTLVSIQGAHTTDLAIAVLGDLTDLSALASTQFPQIRVADGPAEPRAIPDHLLMMAHLAGGAPVTIEVAGGRPADATPFRLEVTGETGQLVLDGREPRGVQPGLLHLFSNGVERSVEAPSVATPETAANVASIYAALRDDIALGSYTVPDFEHAVRMARLIDDVLASSSSRRWRPVSDLAR